jgi:hypothetical protein
MNGLALDLRARSGVRVFFAWLGKEWRSQRGMLLAYFALASVCLAGGLLVRDDLLEPAEWRVFVPALFVWVGVLGVLVFVAPHTVRGEFTGRDDQFLRRLPGALAPATAAKLTFVALAALVLPCAGFVLGQLFLAIQGIECVAWRELLPGAGRIAWTHQRASFLIVAGVLALMLAPWVVAVATWLPGGRMAFGGAGVLVALVTGGVATWLRPYPDFWRVQAPRTEPWLGWLALLGVAAAGVSLARGRRGGGIARSAKLGGLVALLGVLPPGMWLAANLRSYRTPDPDSLARVHIDGVTPDLRFAVGRGSADARWFGVPMRFDLRTGAAEQISDVQTGLAPDLLRPHFLPWGAPQRFWRLSGGDGSARVIFDAMTGARHTLVGTEPVPVVDGPLRTAIDLHLRATTALRLPGGRRATILGSTLYIDTPEGEVTQPWPHQGLVHAAGHGVVAVTSASRVLFDLTRRRVVQPSGFDVASGFCVNGLWLVSGRDGTKFKLERQIFDPDDGSLVDCPELHRSNPLCLWNDDEALMVVRHPMAATSARERAPGDQLFTFHLRARRRTPIELPAALGNGQVFLRRQHDAYGLRDPRGRLWLTFVPMRKDSKHDPDAKACLLAVEPHTRQVTEMARGIHVEVLGFPDADSVLVLEDEQRIVRIDHVRGTRQVVFPHKER